MRVMTYLVFVFGGFEGRCNSAAKEGKNYSRVQSNYALVFKILCINSNVYMYCIM